MTSHKYDSNCTLGAKCRTHGDTQELETQLLHLKEGESLAVGPSDNKTIIKQMVNGGAYGQIYIGELQSDKTKVAVKVEKQGTGHEKLLHEGTAYRKLEGMLGIPKMYWFGMHGEQYNMLVMDFLGPSLNDLFENNDQKFSLKTVLLLIDQIYDIFKHVHKKGFLHRDISPSNFVMGSSIESRHRVHLIDFGLSKKIDAPGVFTIGGSRRTSFHINHAVVGTPRYVSLNAHQGCDAGWRDDVEALSYMWVYFLKGNLPWMGLKANSYAEKLIKIAQVKSSMNGREICSGIPDEFALNVDYCRHLKSQEFPNYKAMQQMFHDLANKREIEYDYRFDWDECQNEAYLGMRVRCESASTPKSLRTHKKIRVKLVPQTDEEKMDEISE